MVLLGLGEIEVEFQSNGGCEELKGGGSGGSSVLLLSHNLGCMVFSFRLMINVYLIIRYIQISNKSVCLPIYFNVDNEKILRVKSWNEEWRRDLKLPIFVVLGLSPF